MDLRHTKNVHKKPTTVENPVDGQYDQVELARLSACLSASFQPTDSPQSSTQMNGDQRSLEGANIEGLEEEQPTNAVHWRRNEQRSQEVDGHWSRGR